MTNTKKQLMTAIAMLVVAALALGTSTYAWFISNQDVKVQEMTFTAQSVEDVQIALTTNAWQGALNGDLATAGAFKTIITAADVKTLYQQITGNENFLTGSALAPASTTNLPDFYVVSEGATAWDADRAETFLAVDNINDNCVRAIPLYIKSSSPTPTSIYYDTNVISVSGDAAPAVRIGFLPEGGTAFIWEPKPYDAGDSTTQIDGRKDTTKNDADGTSKAISSTGANTITTAHGSTLPTGAIFTDMQKNEVKRLIVYIWLEGCDWDCVSGISADQLTVNLGFTSNVVTP